MKSMGEVDGCHQKNTVEYGPQSTNVECGDRVLLQRMPKALREKGSLVDSMTLDKQP